MARILYRTTRISVRRGDDQLDCRSRLARLDIPETEVIAEQVRRFVTWITSIFKALSLRLEVSGVEDRRNIVSKEVELFIGRRPWTARTLS